MKTKGKKSYAINHYKFLKQLTDKDNRSKLLKGASPSQIRAILELAVNNVINAKSPNHKVTSLVRNCCSPTLHKKGHVHVKPLGIVKAKSILNQKGGFLPFLPLLLSALPLIGKAALAGAVTAGAGHLVNKAINQS